MSQNGWHRVDPADVPDDGRVRSVVVDGRTVALSRCGARLGAWENRCPHQGGPLGEGSIEKGLLQLPPLRAEVRTVADVMVETLVAHSVIRVFGMVGHSNLGFADALRWAEQRGELTYIGIRHEGAAAFAASAYGKLTGRPHRDPGHQP